MITLYAHPFSSYCQKALIALYANGTPFSMRKIEFDKAEDAAALAELWPLKRIPVLLDDRRSHDHHRASAAPPSWSR